MFTIINEREKSRFLFCRSEVGCGGWGGGGGMSRLENYIYTDNSCDDILKTQIPPGNICNSTFKQNRPMCDTAIVPGYRLLSVAGFCCCRLFACWLVVFVFQLLCHLCPKQVIQKLVLISQMGVYNNAIHVL